MSLRDEILAGARLGRESLEVEGLGTVWIREWSGSIRFEVMIEAQRRELDAEGEKRLEQIAGFREFVAVRSLCDESGALEFTADEADSVGRGITDDGLQAIYDRAMSLNKMDGADVEELAGK